MAVAAAAWRPWLHPTPTLATLAAIVVLALVPLGRPMAPGALARTGLGALAVAVAAEENDAYHGGQRALRQQRAQLGVGGSLVDGRLHG